MAAFVESTQVRHRLSRGAFGALGGVFLAMGVVGIFVPIWPTTIFCILALWCFKRSSERMENWLLSNRVLGPTLRDWEESRSMTLRAKYLAIGAIWICIGASIFFVHKSWVKAMLLVIALSLTWYLATRPTKEVVAKEVPEAA